MAENNQPVIKYYDDYPTLADRNYVAKPIQESFTGGAAKIQNKSEGTKRKQDFILKELGLENASEVQYTIQGNTISVERHVETTSIDKEELERKKAEYLKTFDAQKVRYAIINVDKNYVKKSELKYVGKEATENLHMSKKDSYMNTDYALQHLIFDNYKEIPNEKLRNYFKKKISKQIGINNLETTQGIFIDINSDSSKNLAYNLMNDNEFVVNIYKYSVALQLNYHFNDSLTLKGSNWHNAIGKADIIDMHINKDGDLELYICDVYDFNRNEVGKVQIGREFQDAGEIIPYFIIYHVIIQTVN